ncbi:Bax inhibitor-1/YccA family protein [Sciscionella sediminilitoris]|uniref:Bax inhibitor-1/YccA family protein n=1 Tax=Sciscionella sediminilitoris TaxID=1445613 RepID=UPI0004DFB6B4|nr:Bax inhibitor-1/YccA family protein [Sciscionella sp. SE31]
MRSSSNPVFRNLPGGGYGTPVGFGGATATAAPQGAQGYGPPPGFGGDQRTAAAERPITIDDVVTKTAITIGLALATGALTFWLAIPALALPGMLVGLVAALVIIFRRKVSPALVVVYSLAEGVFLGSLTRVFDGIAPGVAFPAILGTFGVFVAMLVVYRTGAIRVTPKLTKWIIGATVGALVLMLGNLLLGLFGINGGLRDGGTLSIVFSLLVIGIAAFNFLLDFDAAERMVRGGAPAKMAWYAAFGLMTTLVWLYLEVLRLASYFMGGQR